MAKKITIEPVFDNTRNRWKIDVPATIAKDGKRYKAWFKTRDLARDHLAGITGKADATAAIPPSLAMEADKAMGILKAWNRDLVEAARELVAALEAIGDAGSLLEAAKSFRAAHDARMASMDLGDAVAEYVKILEGRVMEKTMRDPTYKSYCYTLQKAFASLHDVPMSDITTKDVEAILNEKAPTSRKMHTRNLRVFWKWATHSKRGWADMAILNDLEAVNVSNDADIEILSVADVKALLKAAEATGPASAAAYAIAIFGGVRMAEIGKLTWGDVGAENIEIGKSVAKKHSRRLVPVCNTLKAWMDATRGDAKDQDPIIPPNWLDVSKSVRRLAGWNVSARLLDNPPKPTRGAWPSNSCRHTCASVQVAIGTPLDDLTFKFGHSGGHDLLRKHYVSRLTKKDALAILAIGPNGTKISNIQAA